MGPRSSHSRCNVLVIHNGDGLELLKTQECDHIITDPDYQNQPDISVYRQRCHGNVIVFCDPIKRPPGPSPQEVLFWSKTRSTKWTSKRCNRFVEEILVYRGKRSVFNPIHWTSMDGMFTDTFITKPDHPYAKPLSLMEKLVLMYSSPGDLVFDPFCGSGTVGIACVRHGRRYVGCEISPVYFRVAESALQAASETTLPKPWARES